MRQKAAMVFVFVASLGVSVAAEMWVARATVPACGRTVVFARDVEPTGEPRFYTAADCETVLTDGVNVGLPGLVGESGVKTVAVRNVGKTSVYVYVAHEGELVNPVVAFYEGRPPVPVWSGGTDTVVLASGQGVELVSMPGKAVGAWFTREVRP